MVTHLEMNGFKWKGSEVEETAMVLRAFAKEMKQDEWEAWVDHVKKRIPAPKG